MPINRKDMYSLVLGKIAQMRGKVSEFERNIRAMNEEILSWEQILTLINPDPCVECNGLGKVQVWYDQDDVKIETCTGCKGTGNK